MAFMTTKRPRETGADGELLAARIERADAFAAHAAAEEAQLATHDPDNRASALDKLQANSDEYRARHRLAEAERRFREADDLDKRRQRAGYEERLRPLCREEIELLKQVERIEEEKGRLIAEANEAGVALGQDWSFLPLTPETPAAESAFRTWERWLSPRL